MIKTLAIVAVAIATLGLGACASKQSTPASTAPASVGYSK